MGPKCAKKMSPSPSQHHQQPEPLRQGRMDPCFHVLYAKFWPYHLNVAAEIKTHQTWQRFSNLLLSNFGDPVWIVAFISCSWLTEAAPGVVFCCCSPSASGFDVLCVQRCILHTLVVRVVIWVIVAFLSSLISLPILLWPLIMLCRTTLCKP